MKRKSLFIGAFTFVLAFTMVLSVYTRVKADDPSNSCTVIGPTQAGAWRNATPYEEDCINCENVGAPYTVNIDGVDYTEQDRAFVTNPVFLNGCENFPNSACVPTSFNPSHDDGSPCNNILIPSTGTN